VELASQREAARRVAHCVLGVSRVERVVIGALQRNPAAVCDEWEVFSR